jgi:hypothetical protein
MQTPLIRGGQGRSSRDVRSTAWCLYALIALALVASAIALTVHGKVVEGLAIATVTISALGALMR